MTDIGSYPLVLDLPEGRIEASLEMPVGGERLVTFAYNILALSSVAADMGARAIRKAGMPVTCSKGCAACCRQLVPLSPPEAAMVAEFVNTLPAPRRTYVQRRFEQAVAQLHHEDLYGALRLLRDPGLSDADDRSITQSYFSLQIACPFLEDEACSIYPVRPTICREYMVVSPPQHCRSPYTETIQKVPLAFRLSQALTAMWAALMKRQMELVPFVCSLEWSRANPEMHTLTVKPEALVRALQEQVNAIARQLGT